ncbi:MAG TPA: hypothetical protein VMB77_13245 [Syntrophales bacterium]|nr:hypothetical protein [Syntrophales bacterium]
MEKKMKICHACKREIAMERKVGRSETCPSCGADLHVCLNCRFYSPGAYNDCTEPQAERVVDKRRSNFCDYFIFREGAGKGAGPEAAPGNARSKLDALFKK